MNRLAAAALLIPFATSAFAETRPAPRRWRDGLSGDSLSAEANRIAGDRNRILVRDWAFDPVAEALPELPPAIRRPEPAGRYRIVQLRGPIDAAARAVLAEIAGITPLRYLPNDAFLVRLENPAAEAALRRTPRVRAVVRWNGAMKLAPELVSWEFPWEDETTLVVQLFAGEDADRLVSEIRRVDPEIRVFEVTTREGRSRVRAALPTANLPQVLSGLAVVDGIEAVEREGKQEFHNDIAAWVIQNYDTAANTNYAVSATIWNHGITGTGMITSAADSGLDSDMCFFRLSGTAGAVTDAQSPVPPATGTVDPTKKVIAYYVQPGSAAYDVAASSYHCTHVCGSIVGDNYSTLSTPSSAGHNTADGMAPNARLVFQDVGNANGDLQTPGDLVTMFTQAHDAGARIHSNSWGATVHSYSSHGADVDAYMWRNEDSLVLYSMGNSGSAPGDGSVGEPASAKNLVSVGGAQTILGNPFNDLPKWSRGPVRDGRRKPDIIAPGTITSAAGDANHASNNCGTAFLQGTSMSTPVTAGALTLLRQYFVDGWYPTGTATAADARIPSGALMKAALLNGGMPVTGYDMTDMSLGTLASPIPSMDQGWGRVHLERSLWFAGDTQRIRVFDVRNADGLATGESTTFTVQVPAGQPLRVTLVWTDPEAATASGTNLVNDLDLEVVDPAGTTTYKGNVFSGGVSVTGGSRDALNPVEGVLVTSPAAGLWTLRVLGTSVPGTYSAPGSERQGFALVASFASCTAGSLTAATGFSATDNGSSGIDLTWNAVAGATGYNVYKVGGNCGAAGSSYSLLRTTSGTSLTDLTVQGGRQYAYLVRAVDGCTEGPPSACGTATSSAVCTIDPVFAGASTATDSSSGGICSIQLSWSAATSSCVLAPSISYNVYRGTASGFVPTTGNRVATGISGTSWTDTNAPSGTTTYYVVRAEDGTSTNGGPANGGNEDRNTFRVHATPMGGGSFSTAVWSDDGGDTVAALAAQFPWSVTSKDNHTPGGGYCYVSAEDGWPYPLQACASLTTVPLGLTSGQPHTLTYWSRYNFEYQWDGVVVEISTNGGSSWQDLGDLGLLSPGYPGSIPSGNPGNACGFLSKSLYTGPSGNSAPTAWAQTTANLATFDGQTIRIRWRLATDSGVEYDGFLLDDISVTNVSRPSGCAPHFGYSSRSLTDSCSGTGSSSGNGVVDPGEDVTISITGINDGGGGLTSVTGTISTTQPGVTILTPGGSFGSVALGAAATSASPHFKVRIGSGVACGTSVPFTVSFSAAQGGPWTGTFSVPVGGYVTTTNNFSSTDPNLPISIPSNNLTGITSTLNIPSGVTISDLNVTVNVTHSRDSDVRLSLIGPTGTTVALATNVASSGANFTNTTFDDEAATAITSGTAPFSGSYRPQASLTAFDGTSSTGTWTLKVVDSANGPGGSPAQSLNSWSLSISNQTLTCGTCTAASSGPRPAPDGSFVSGSAMKGTRNGGTVDVTWDATTCTSGNYSLYSGAIGSFGAITGGTCSLGTSGSVSSVAIAGDSFWLIAGTSGSEVSSFGRTGTGAEETFAGWGSGGICPSQITQNLSGTCP